MDKTIRLEMKATLKRFLPDAHGSYPIKPGLRVRTLIERLDIPEYEVNIVFIDGVLANLDAVLAGGERVTLFPPMGGG